MTCDYSYFASLQLHWRPLSSGDRWPASGAANLVGCNLIGDLLLSAGRNQMECDRNLAPPQGSRVVPRAAFKKDNPLGD